MIKRIIKIAQAEFNGHRQKNKQNEKGFPLEEPAYQEPVIMAPDPLAQYYANLEIPVGSDRTTVKKAWKTQMKKYHPDLHCADPEKKRIAEELTFQLTEAHRILDTALLKNVRGENNGRF